MSSPLAFDKQANPFSFHRRTRQLRVRLFRNPSARGTCSVVLDADGSPLFIDADTEYPVFRQLVGNVPGLYRLDQCDDGGTEVEDVTPAYVTIDPPRNGQAFGSGGDDGSALAVIREMAAVQREMAAIQGQALKALADNHALILASAAEVMRAPRPTPLPVELRNAVEGDATKVRDEDDDENDDDDEGIEGEEQTSGAIGLLAQFAKMIDPKDARKLGSWLMAKFFQFRQETASAPINVGDAPVGVAAAPVAVTAAPGHTTGPRVDASQGVKVVAVPPTASVVTHEVIVSDVATEGVTPEMSTGESATGAPTEQVTGQIAALTQEQLMHIAMINAQLSPEEQSTAEQVMRRMNVATVQRWLLELSTLSVEDATATVRQAIAERNQRRTKPTR